MALNQVIVVLILFTLFKAKILKKPKGKNKLKWIIGITLVYATVLLKVYFDERVINAYEILGVSRAFGIDEIKESYRAALKFKHPDKNSSPNANEEFREFKKAYDLIRNLDSQIKYEKYSIDNVNAVHSSSFIWFGSWVFISTGLIFSKYSNSGRNLLCVVSLVGLYQYFITEGMLFTVNKYLCRFTIYEQIEILRTLMYPLEFLLCALESYWAYQRKLQVRGKIKRFLKGEGKNIIEALEIKGGESSAGRFISAVKFQLKKKYESNTFGNLISLGLMIYFFKNSFN